MKPVNPRRNQPWIFIGRTDAEAEAPVLWPPDGKSQLIGKDPDSGKDWGQKEKGVTLEWDGWMASPTQWTWIWANSGRQWRTEQPGVLQSMRQQRVGHHLRKEQQQKQHLVLHICCDRYCDEFKWIVLLNLPNTSVRQVLLLFSASQMWKHGSSKY